MLGIRRQLLLKASMRIRQVKIENFRGVKYTSLLLANHGVLVGDNNVGKSTVLEAIDLVLGPERLSRQSAIDEHDFYAGVYLDEHKVPVLINVEVILTDLSAEQKRRFVSHLEYWDSTTNQLIEGPPEAIDGQSVVAALRIGLKAGYDADEDNFDARTSFMWPIGENGELDPFRTQDKRQCGFLFLRTLRTGSRALSLERGSLLDILLRLMGKRLDMWEGLLNQLRQLQIGEVGNTAVVDVLNQIQASIRKFVPAEWSANPQLRVSELTRETLRKVLSVFIETGTINGAGEPFSAPFHHQGTGTLNMLVLALLSMIAEAKKDVIFAMEEPEIAIPPHTQRRVVSAIRKMSSQSLFTSHSPYVLEEFDRGEIVILRRNDGMMTQSTAALPSTVKLKAYRSELRMRFCECLLARRVLIVEGRTEYDAMTACARTLHEHAATTYTTLEAQGIAVIDAQGDNQVAPLGRFFKDMGKDVYAVFDKQTPDNLAFIKAEIDHAFESPYNSFEKLIVEEVDIAALRRHGISLVSDNEWPASLDRIKPAPEMSDAALKDSMYKYLEQGKGAGYAALLLSSCAPDEVPRFITDSLLKIQSTTI